ncbi:MAG: DUF4492 domain-containing protein [Prevotella sp.]|jgi:hypothetical protein|uniref:DUF4492 domain-containing protein n=1 Tax=Segatella cerevisiae TaxID=2053716 RepID=A0ABT1BZC0_9BACT|nr:DUF4492 domain-containing protein [Segatella cerevisiae]MCH3994174.1 DUF4492 domain-containing protein [Prevotella sp.]MCI1247135.1 DUF4492 domain-containing protein [Prevotella sp.]MCO6026185.1 DUF4492 domain-containing protein [Segatella cerevisiae]
MKRNKLLSSVFHLYYDGFRDMTVGKTLWTVILIKLFIIFAILKVFFFPDFINHHAKKGQESQFVSEQVLGRKAPADVLHVQGK